MAEMNNEIVKMAVDLYHGRPEKYSVSETNEALRSALVELNGGDTKLNYRAIRDGKCNGLFTIIEEILDRTVVEGLQQNDFFMNLVDFRNLAAGDKNEFVVEDSTMFFVDKIAGGTQAVRRQRLSGVTTKSINTTVHAVRIYEELNRILSGRVDFNDMISKVSESYTQEILNEIFTLWNSATADDFGGAVYFPTAGAYSESALLDVISHVEAAAGGKQATILGTKKAVRNLVPSILSSSAKEDLYEQGYIGRFFGCPVVVTPQRHKINSTTFQFDDDIMTIIAGDDKMIKFVYEGDPIVLTGDPMTNMDLTQEYLYSSRFGCGIVTSGNGGIGRYEIA